MTRYPAKDTNYYFQLLRKDDNSIKYLEKYYSLEIIKKDSKVLEILAGIGSECDNSGARPVRFYPHIHCMSKYIWCLVWIGSPQAQYNYLGKRSGILWKDAHWYYNAMHYLINNYWNQFNVELCEALTQFLYIYLNETLKGEFSESLYRYIMSSNIQSKTCVFIKQFKSTMDDNGKSSLDKDEFLNSLKEYVHNVQEMNTYQLMTTLFK